MNEQRLGFRTFLFYSLQGVFPAIISFVAAILLAALPQTGLLDGAATAFGIPTESFTNILWYIFGGLILITLAIIVFGIIIAYIRYLSCSFSINEFGFKIRKGFLSKYETSIPFKQVQDVSIDQSILFRIFGLAKVVILTAGNDEYDSKGESEGELDIIDISVAKKIHDTLLKNAGAQVTVKVENQKQEGVPYE